MGKTLQIQRHWSGSNGKDSDAHVRIVADDGGMDVEAFTDHGPSSEIEGLTQGFDLDDAPEANRVFDLWVKLYRAEGYGGPGMEYGM